jgi:DNA primase
MDKAKAKEIFSDAVFVTSLLKLETAEEAQKALKARGLEVSLDDLQAIGYGLEKAAENGGKLSEDDLEKVAGGFIRDEEDPSQARKERWRILGVGK